MLVFFLGLLFDPENIGGVSVDFQWPTWYYISKDRILHDKLCTYFFLETNHRGLSGIPKNPKNCILAGTAAKPSMYLECR
jgi:hypothetical protein